MQFVTMALIRKRVHLNVQNANFVMQIDSNVLADMTSDTGTLRDAEIERGTRTQTGIQTDMLMEKFVDIL